jgi:hypothetical protein
MEVLNYDKYKEISSLGQKWALSPLLLFTIHVLFQGMVFCFKGIHHFIIYTQRKKWSFASIMVAWQQ